LSRLSAEWNVTAIGVQVSELDRMSVVALARSPSPFSLHVDVGSQFPALISATGRLVAAHSTLPWSTIERQFKQLRWQRAIALTAWKKEVEMAKRRGYALDKGNYIEGVTLAAVPIVDAAGRLTNTLVCAGFNQQLKGTKIISLVSAMRNEAAALEAQLLQ
jgi:DNA-binding IclR family transcriptional regulator